MDLQNDPGFQSLGVEIVSVAFDSAEEQLAAIAQYGITDVPMLVDDEHTMSETYDVLQWAVGSGEPGHTFILVDEEGKLAWIRDYGAPENGGLMYVPVGKLGEQIARALDS